MVAPNYAKARSELAKTMGLGLQRRKEAGQKADQESRLRRPGGRTSGPASPSTGRGADTRAPELSHLGECLEEMLDRRTSSRR